LTPDEQKKIEDIRVAAQTRMVRYINRQATVQARLQILQAEIDTLKAELDTIDSEVGTWSKISQGVEDLVVSAQQAAQKTTS
jgi:prefoldin subunit 5